jgi:hypothetical protein
MSMAPHSARPVGNIPTAQGWPMPVWLKLQRSEISSAILPHNYQTGLNELLEVLAPKTALTSISFDDLTRLKDEYKIRSPDQPATVENEYLKTYINGLMANRKPDDVKRDLQQTLENLMTCVLLTDGTMVLGIVLGISKSRKTLCLSRARDLHTPRDMQVMFYEIAPERIASMWKIPKTWTETIEESRCYRVDQDAVIGFDETVWGGSCFTDDFASYQQWPERILREARDWLKANGRVPFSFVDALNDRLRTLARRENFHLTFGHDHAAVGEQPAIRFGDVNISRSTVLYFDWLSTKEKSPVPNSFSAEADVAYYSLMWREIDAIAHRHTNTPISELSEDLPEGTPILLSGVLGPENVQHIRMEADSWVCMRMNDGGRNNRRDSSSSWVPVCFRHRSLVFSEKNMVRVKTPFSVFGEMTKAQSPFGSEWRVKAKAAFVRFDGSYEEQ